MTSSKQFEAYHIMLWTMRCIKVIKVKNSDKMQALFFYRSRSPRVEWKHCFQLALIFYHGRSPQVEWKHCFQLVGSSSCQSSLGIVTSQLTHHQWMIGSAASCSLYSELSCLRMREPTPPKMVGPGMCASIWLKSEMRLAPSCLISLCRFPFDYWLVRKSVRDLVHSLDLSLVAEIESNDSAEHDSRMHLPNLLKERSSKAPGTLPLHSFLSFSLLQLMLIKYFKMQSDYLLV